MPLTHLWASPGTPKIHEKRTCPSTCAQVRPKGCPRGATAPKYAPTAPKWRATASKREAKWRPGRLQIHTFSETADIEFNPLFTTYIIHFPPPQKSHLFPPWDHPKRLKFVTPLSDPKKTLRNGPGDPKSASPGGHVASNGSPWGPKCLPNASQNLPQNSSHVQVTITTNHQKDSKIEGKTMATRLLPMCKKSQE